MIVPTYWAEAREQRMMDGRSVTLRRFGWSDHSDAEAQQHADGRLAEAWQAWQRGEDIRRLERKVAYNGADGLPIREEVVSRHDDVVISRNGYGALCLNTPDVMFVDIDGHQGAPAWLSFVSFLLCLVPAVAAAIRLQFAGWLWGLTGLIVLLATFVLTRLLRKIYIQWQGGEDEYRLRPIREVVHAHPELHLRVYATPAGLRVLMMQDVYAPEDPATVTLMQRLGADPVYVRMCRNQRCFRARLSPKPWRIGVSRLPAGLWPVSRQRLAERREWVRQYERQAQGYAACRFIGQLGSGTVSPRAHQVMQLHDRMCQAHKSGLPLA